MTVYVEGDLQLAGATPAEYYRYDNSGYRWFKVGRDGVPELSLRGADGQILADFTMTPGSNGTPVFTIEKEYVSAFGQLLVERKYTATTWTGLLPE